jgi:hypothetical protein
MWIVKLALRRPYTFIVLAIFIFIAGVLSILSTPKDIFPSINIPVISVIFNFPGFAPKDLEQHLTTVYERVLTTTVDNIEHIESESLFGIAVVKIYLQPTASVPRGIAQVTSVSQAILSQLPSGTTPPLVLSYSATNLPVLRVGLSGLSEQQDNDLGFNFVRPQLITVPGVSVPYPYGGKRQYVEVDRKRSTNPIWRRGSFFGQLGRWNRKTKLAVIENDAAVVAECAVNGIKDNWKGEVPCGLVVLKADVNQMPAEVEREIVTLLRDKIGPVAAFKIAIVVSRLPQDAVRQNLTWHDEENRRWSRERGEPSSYDRVRADSANGLCSNTR